MKYLFAIIILTIFTFQSYGQKTSKLKVGLGLPVFLGNEDSGTELNKVSAFPTISVEKPIPVKIKRDEKISFNPGVAFFYFKEKEEWGNEDAGGSKNLNNFSFNGYLKAFYKQPIQKRSDAFIYFGGIAGVHIFTQTTGIDKAHSINTEHGNFENDVKQSGKDFFNTIYYGPILGFQPDAKITNRIVPSFELSFFPGFVSRLTGEKASAVQITVLLGIN